MKNKVKLALGQSETLKYLYKRDHILRLSLISNYNQNLNNYLLFITTRMTESKTLFVGYLSSKVGESDLQDCFAGLEGVSDIKIIRNHQKNSCKGYAFVTIDGGQKNLEDALNAEIFFEGRKLELSEALCESKKFTYLQRQVDHKIHVKNLKKTVNDVALKEFFSQYGEVVNCYVIYNPHTGASKRFGYVEFFEKESVDKVLAEPQVLFQNKKVVVNRYAPKAYLEKQKEGSLLAARTGSKNQADCDPVKGALDSTSSGSIEISQNSVNKIRDGDLKTKDLTQQIFNQNPNFTNCANQKLGHKKGFGSMLSSPHDGSVVMPTNNRSSFDNVFPSNPTIPVRNTETPFFNVDDYRNSISSQNYQQAPQAYQQAPQAYQPQYQDSVYAQPQSYAPEANEYYYYYDYEYVQDQSSSQFGSQNSQDQPQQQQEYYYAQDCYTVPGNYHAAQHSDHQFTYTATQANVNVNSYATGYQNYPAQTGQLSNSQGNLPQGYATPTQQTSYPLQGQDMPY